MSENKPKKKALGSVVINAERCKGCGFCIEFCPPRVLKFSEQYNSKGYHTPVLFEPDGCTGCGMCGLICPDIAIYGFLNAKKKKLETPLESRS
jgi:2-oxoglutarate ferredoxin oxidoreductase subunit delta